jgi:hypothetical protein
MLCTYVCSGEYNVFDVTLTLGRLKVAGSISTVVRLTFQPARCGYTLRVSNIKNNMSEC